MRDSPESVHEFVVLVSKLRFESAFNPYSQRCETYDLPDAPAIRRANLTNILDAATTGGVDSLWVARDLGHRGGRRTGLAMTDDLRIVDHARMFSADNIRRATKDPAMSEATAGVVWRALNRIGRPIFLWNVFPLHPYSSLDQLSNRSHTKSEGDACAPLMRWLIQKLKPRKIVAIGSDAHSALQNLGYPSDRVRHPSYGGQPLFRKGIGKLYGLRID